MVYSWSIIAYRLNCINECICADNIDNVKTQMPVLSKISDHPKDFSELSKLISEEQVDIQEQLDKMDQDFAIDLSKLLFWIFLSFWLLLTAI